MISTPAITNSLTDPSLGFPVNDWQTTRPTERISAIKRRLLETQRVVDVERARYATESYQGTEGEPMIIRRAKMLLHLVRSMSITIYPDEIIVGNRSLLPRMGIIAPEGAVDWIDKELGILSSRPQDRFNIQPEHIRELREKIFPYWQGKTLEDIVASRVPEDVRRVVKGKAFSLNQTDHAQGHILPDAEAWLQLGIGGLREQVLAAQRLSNVQTPAQAAFYEAALIVLQAASEFMDRYATLAWDKAESFADETRRRELQKISEVCEWLSEYPARDFREALQTVWFLFVVLQIESNASSFSPGRFDQYILPYLEHDLASGRLTLADAQELLEHMWLKFSEVVLLRSSSSARYFAGFPIGFNIVLGGQLSDGRDATNILSYMCLRAQADLGLTQPNLSVRVHEYSPEDFLRTAAFVIGKGAVDAAFLVAASREVGMTVKEFPDRDSAEQWLQDENQDNE